MKKLSFFHTPSFCRCTFKSLGVVCGGKGLEIYV